MLAIPRSAKPRSYSLAQRPLVRMRRPSCMRRYSSVSARPEGFVRPPSQSRQLLDFLTPFTDEEKEMMYRDYQIYPNFITQEQHDMLVKEIDSVLGKKRYQQNHWDRVITGYKETEKSVWSPENMQTLQQVRAMFPPTTIWLPAVHVIDLQASGPIDAHIDTLDFCGGIVAGLCLLSGTTMILHRERDNKTAVALLEPRTLYIMRRTVRYEFTHAIPANSYTWRGVEYPRQRRISIMFRDEVGNTDVE